jgi:ankyrin repeat protein
MQDQFIVRTRRILLTCIIVTILFMVMGASIAWGSPIYWLTLLLLGFTGPLAVLRYCWMQQFNLPLTTSDWLISGVGCGGLVIAAFYSLRTPQWTGFYPALVLGLLAGLLLIGLPLKTHWKEWLILTTILLVLPLYTLRFASLFPSIAAGNKASLELLLRFGADPNERQQNDTVLGEAVRLSRLDMLDPLLREGADVNARSSTFMNSTPILFTAAYTQEALPILGTLLLHGADPNETNNSGETALFAAIRMSYLRNAQELLDKGANINVRNTNGESALFGATTYEAAKFLLDRGIAVDVRNKTGRTAIFSAAAAKSVGLLELLRSAGLSVNETDKLGQTPLLGFVATLTTDLGHEPVPAELEVIRYLLAHGADINYQDKAGRSALAIAHQSHFKQLETLLQQSGAH